MADYLALPRQRIDVVYPGISRRHLAQDKAPLADARPPTVGYLARICPEKGLDRLVDVLALLRKMPGMSGVRLRAAGYLGPAHRRWFSALLKRIRQYGLTDAVTYIGEVDLAGKLAFLDSIDLLSVPTARAEPKGMYVLESLARGVPVVLPDHGAFPELVKMTGGGVLAAPADPQALADAIAHLLADPARRKELGTRGRLAVEARFTDDHMAARMLDVYQHAIT
jgi:glycosyltransferase involved in cell wall biosynthesis